ncbi:5-formyltetrahydrofolate cyclo-ligase [Candidatus Bathyarchaeota archaeon]|nr:5-formyltetrahydrofolate cyclo-ligase [Candidatus Bathyarchaeota archaeon]MBS7629524.1 5-formyltetrahydrofolate cyclo-ligase [Candidatus Bathyarchaeota archaeon]
MSVWRLMEENNVARPPRPVYGRIPNFEGAERAAERVLELDEFAKADTVKVNPDSPQRPLRELVLKAGKNLLTPTPRLRCGFLLIKPGKVHEKNYGFASTIRGSFKYGVRVDLDEIPKPAFIIVGSVAVTPEGSRLGKGSGYSELECGILAELGLIDEETPIATTVHELQIVEYVPREAYDINVDYILTPEREVRTGSEPTGRKGIIWSMVTGEMMRGMPILENLYRMRRI